MRDAARHGLAPRLRQEHHPRLRSGAMPGLRLSVPRRAAAKAQGYWRDVGTVDAFWQANMELIEVDPVLDLYDRDWPIWTYQEQLPPAKFVFDDRDRRGMALNSMVSGGCIVSGATLSRSLLFSNVRVETHATGRAVGGAAQRTHRPTLPDPPRGAGQRLRHPGRCRDRPRPRAGPGRFYTSARAASCWSRRTCSARPFTRASERRFAEIPHECRSAAARSGPGAGRLSVRGIRRSTNGCRCTRAGSACWRAIT